MMMEDSLTYFSKRLLRNSEIRPPKPATLVMRSSTNRTWSFPTYQNATVQEVRQLLPEEGILVNVVGRDDCGAIVVFDIEFKVYSEPERSRLRS